MTNVTVPLGRGAAQRAEVHTCPSRSCEEGVDLLGVMTTGGHVAYLTPRIPVDSDFANRIREGGSPERRFRFSGPCVEGSCPQWTGTECAVANIVIAEAPARLGADARLPACTIRRSCRWFAQRGAAACLVCPTIVADQGGTRTFRSNLSEASSDPVAEPDVEEGPEAPIER